MCNDLVPTSSRILNDNWALQIVADFLSRRDDPSDEWGWIAAGSKGPCHGSIKAGVFQIECLLSLLEQILFAEEIYVLEGWQDAWLGKRSDLDKLYTNESGSIIKPYDPNRDKIDQAKPKWLNHLLNLPGLKSEFDKGMELYERGYGNYFTQVVNGIADYLSMSELLSCTYSPHPARSGFLKSTMWNVPLGLGKNWPTSGIRSFNKIVDTARVKIMERIGIDEIAIRLATYIPSAAMLSIAESSQTTSPVEVALELRNEKEIVELRSSLHNLTLSMVEGDFNEVNKSARLFNIAAEKAEQNLLSFKMSQDDDQAKNINIDLFGITALDRDRNNFENIITEYKHAGILTRLIKTANTDIVPFLENKLKIDDPSIFRQLFTWHDEKFFNNIEKKDQSIIKIYQGCDMREIKVSDSSKVVIATDSSTIEGAGIDQTNINIIGQYDLKVLSDELNKLIECLKKEAKDPEQFQECAAISEAQKAVNEKDNNKLIAALKKAGTWSFNVATRIGCSIAASVIKTAMGI